MGDPEPLRASIIRFARDYFLKQQRSPSIKDILRGCSVSRKRLYSTFAGLADICSAAGIPEPAERIRRTSQASSARGRALVESRTRQEKKELAAAPFRDRMAKFQSQYEVDEASAVVSPEAMVTFCRSLPANP